MEPWQAFLLGAFVAWVPFGFMLALLICRSMEGRPRR